MKLFTRRALCALLSAALVAGALPMGAMADTGQGSSPPSQTAQQEDAPAPQETAPLEGTVPPSEEDSATPAPTEGPEGEGAQEPSEERPEEPAGEETPGSQPDGETGELTLLPQEWAGRRFQCQGKRGGKAGCALGQCLL